MRSNYLPMVVVLCGLLVTGCASAPPMQRVTYEEKWKDGKAPDTNTLLTCTKYANVASSYAREKRTPPPVQNVVNVNVTTPREYEGEISNCNYSTCEISLKETRSSRIASSIQETSNQMQQSYEQLGAALGNAIAEGKKRRRAERAYKEALNECFELGGFEKEQRGVVELSLSKLSCDGPSRSILNRDIKQKVRFTNGTSSRINLVYFRPSGKQKTISVLRPRKTTAFTLNPGSTFKLLRNSDEICLASITVPEYSTGTTTLKLSN